MSKKISTPIGIIIITILVIIVGGFTWWQYGKIYKEESNAPEVQIPEKKTETVSSFSENSTLVESSTVKGWRTYTNRKYGYQIDYPNDWTLSKNILGAFSVYNKFDDYYCSVEVYADVGGDYMYPIEEGESYFQGFSEENVSAKKAQVIIDSIYGTELSSHGLDGRKIYFLEKEIGNKNYHYNIFLEVIKKDQYGEMIIKEHSCKDILTRILFTFRIIDEGVDNLATEPICQYRKAEFEQRIYDSQGRMTGIKNGEIREEIPGSYYDPEAKSIHLANEDQLSIYENFCIKDGNYIHSVNRGQGKYFEGPLIFRAVNIPITSGVTHRYVYDWEALAKGEDGVAIFIDIESDGSFDKLITSDEELSCQDFISQLKKR